MKAYLILVFVLLMGCSVPQKEPAPKIRVVFDTDTNNELDDQHALAYLLFNQEIFKIEAITINTTSSGESVEIDHPNPEETDQSIRSKLTTVIRRKLTTLIRANC
ncbi:MAG: hypothetical protein KF775_04850, partial [Cyclobacteriaceae bacterium]|nr:hypothetical protein [Cyclobacteriaceae bacterium]